MDSSVESQVGFLLEFFGIVSLLEELGGDGTVERRILISRVVTVRS